KPGMVGGLKTLTSPGVDGSNNPLPPQFRVWIASNDDPAHPVFFGAGTAIESAPDMNGITTWSASITAALNSSIVPGSYKAYVYGDNGASLTNNAVQNDDGFAKADTANFQYPTLTADITVTQATPVITVLASQNATYTGSPYAGPVTCSAVGPNNESIPATLTYAGTGGTIYASSSTPPPNVGTYSAVCSAGDGTGDYAATSQSAAFTIGAASSLTTVSCPAGVTYNGSAQTPCTATVTGIGGLNQTLTVTYTDNINVGTATASASFAG